MADGSYKVEAEISTSNSVTNLRALNTAIDSTTTALKALNTVTKEGERDLKSMVSSITAVLAEQRRAVQVEKDLATAKIATAKATAVQQAAEDKHAESLARVELTQSRTAKTSVQSASAQEKAEQALWNTRTKAMSDWTAQQSQGIAAEKKYASAQAESAAAAEKAKQNELQLTDQLSNTRYLLYDVGATYATMAAGLEALPVATAAVAAAYQRDFAQVQRVTEGLGDGGQQLMSQLKDIATQIPISFGQLTQIEQLGAQLGIANDQLSAFTDTTAKYVTVTGVTADSAAQTFGRMASSFNADGNIPDFFNKLGSSIAEVGAKTVATDPEISAMLAQIGPLGASAGFTADQMVGLSAALASVRVQPELARGTLTRVFANLNRDAAEGGTKMAAFGKVMDLTGQQAAALWKSDPSTFFENLIGGLNTVQKTQGNLTSTFDGLGITSVRDVSALTKMAVGYDTLKLSMDTANQSFQDGTALDSMAQPVFDTVVAKLQELGNALGNLASDLGSGLFGPISSFLDLLKSVVTGFDGFMSAVPIVKILISTLLGLSAVAGVFLGLRAAQAFILAGLVSFQQMLGSSAAGAANFTGILKQLAVTQLMQKGATEQQANALLKEVSAFKSVGIAAAATNVEIKTLQTANENAATSLESLGTKAASASTKFAGFGKAVLGLVGGLPGLITMIGVGLVGALLNAASQAAETGKAISDAFAKSQSSGLTAVADELRKKTVDAFSAPALVFSDWGQNAAQIADKLKLPFDQMVAAIGKGKDGVQQIQQILDAAAQSRGFKSLDDLTNANGANAGELTFIKNVMTDMANANTQEAQTSAYVADGLKKSGGAAATAATQYGDLTDGTDGATTATDKLDKALQGLNDTIFGTLDKQAALGDSLQKLGGGLQKSGSFNNSENGRANVKNLEDSLKAAQEYYAIQYKTGQLTAAQASAGYGSAEQQILGRVTALGGNVGAIKDLADQTVTQFGADLAAAASGADQPTIAVGATADRGQAAAAGQAAGAAAVAGAGTPTILTRVDTVQPVQQAQAAGQQVASVIAAQNASGANKFQIDAGTDQPFNKVLLLAQSLSKITGQPYQVVLDALTDPANQNAKKMQDYITAIVNGTYKAAVNADTTAAITNVKNFANYAFTQLQAVQNYVNGLASTAPTLAQFIVPGTKPNLTGVPYKPGLGGGTLSTVADTPVPVQATAAATAAQAGLGDTINNVNDGYQKQQAAADKAGAAGKKAGKDTAEGWQDAYNGISKATSLADEYASRLKQGFDRAFESQYGVQTATDAYYQKLNDIKKSRDDELKQVDDLRDKIKALNDEMGKDQIDANKAKIEQAISLKYGEGDRAADYGNKAQTALDDAAAKKKEMDADKAQAAQIQSGIGLLTGYSEAAIKNRADLRELEQKQLDMVVAYAKTGASIDQVRAYSQNLNAQFQRDVTQIGFNQIAVQNLTGNMGRYTDVINKVPYFKPTTVTADTTQADNALADLGGKYDNLAGKLGTPIEVNLRANWDWNVQQLKGTDGNPIWSAISNVGGVDQGSGYVKANYEGGLVEGYDSGGLVPGTPPANRRQDNLLAMVDGKRPISIRSREFIQPQEAVDYYGVDFMEKVRKRQLPRFFGGGSVGGSSGGGGGVQVVELTAEQLAFLASTMGREVKLYADNRVIAEASNRGNREIASEGGRR